MKPAVVILKFVLVALPWYCTAGAGVLASDPLTADTTVLRCGADRSELYLPLVLGKKTAVVANPTSLTGGIHLVDHLLNQQVKVVKVFAPEHGFRGEAGAGDKVKDGKDPRSGIPVVSLYGKKRKPSEQDLEGVDVVLFDIQDVGVRFYTFIATLQYVMEACADLGIPVIVLDRPNPNGHYIDGPVMEPAFRSFVGRTPIPVVHGCTIGEYARMLAGEGWLDCKKPVRLDVIPVSGYSHLTHYRLPVRPSPNLPTMNAVYLYPSVCFFEGTRVSLGRGTPFPFEVFGFPEFPDTAFSFRPVSIPGVAVHPPYEDTLCYGRDLRGWADPEGHPADQLDLSFLHEAYAAYSGKRNFFTDYFNLLAGTADLKKQIIQGLSDREIRTSWQEGLKRYRQIRKKYLLYPDFE